MSRGVLLGLLIALALPAEANEIWRSGEASLTWKGSVRELAVVTRQTDVERFNRAFAPLAARPLPADPRCLFAVAFADCPAFSEIGETTTFSSLTRLRQELAFRFRERWSIEAAYDHTWVSTTERTFERSFGGAFAPAPFVDLDQEILTPDRSVWSHRLYRGFATYRGEHLELVVGRQRIPWGVGRLWNPLDRFNAIGPLALEADITAGVDAVRARWNFDGFRFAEAIYAAGRHGRDRDMALRVGTVWRETDLALVGGIFDEAHVVGAELATNLGDAAGRVEAIFTDPERRVRRVGELRPDELRPYWQVVVSVDTNLDWGTGLYVLAEYLYNGNALGFGAGEAGTLLGFFEETGGPPAATRIAVGGDLDLLGTSQVVTFGRHLIGTQLGYDLSPELRLDVVVLFDAERGSATAFPSLRYSPLGWLEVTLATQLFTGKRRSEYGSAEPIGFLLAEVFF